MKKFEIDFDPSKTEQFKHEIKTALSEPNFGQLKVNMKRASDFQLDFFENIDNEFNIEVIFSADSDDLVGPKADQYNVKIEPYADKIALEADAKFTNEIGFNQIWKGILPNNYLVDSEKVLLELISPNESIKFTHDNKLVGMICMLRGKTPPIPRIDTLGWIWIKNEISHQIRLEVHALTLEWLREREAKIQLAVYYRNIRSIRFHQKLGFKPICIRYTRF